MCTGLCVAASCGALLDVILLFNVSGFPSESWEPFFFMAVHLIYSCFVCTLGGPILWLHVGFISRNELANEWKNNSYYVAYSHKMGDKIPVNDMSDDEFNAAFDMFEYDSDKNPWDRGCTDNCFLFWCTPRAYGPGELGEF